VAEADVAHCSLHPGIESRRTCKRCGRFTCGVCVSSDSVQCVQCYAWAEEHASPRAELSIRLAYLGMFGLVPAAIAAMVLVRRERRAISQVDAPRGGSDVLTSATLIASWSLVFYGLPLVFYAVWWLFVRPR